MTIARKLICMQVNSRMLEYCQTVKPLKLDTLVLRLFYYYCGHLSVEAVLLLLLLLCRFLRCFLRSNSGMTTG